MNGLCRERRDKLRKLIPKLRKETETAFEVRFKSLGIFTECSKSHSHTIQCYLRPVRNNELSEKEIETRQSILAAIEREKKGFKAKEPERTQKAINRYIQGCAYTLINKLSAIKAMELRGLFEETVTKRDKYEGLSFREYKIRRKQPGIAPDQLIEEALNEAFSDAAKEITMIFDTHPYGYTLPRVADLKKIVAMLNDEIDEEDWLADDILGWIYQFWNEEARKQYRTGRGRGSRKAPEADDIPVINQLYTPHWVVKVLTDNTLGRLWLEMNGRCPWREATHLVNKPEDETVDTFCSYLVPLPSEPQKVELKHPKEIKVLDPACGSGHFLIYAFEVFWRIWREVEPSLEPEEIARNILKFNLYGIDIDLRATQLAAVGLYLKAKELIENELRKRNMSQHEITKRVKDFRPERMNIISADTRILDGSRKENFLKYFKNDPDLYEIVRKLFDDLNYTYEYGSLLKVREPFERLFKARKKPLAIKIPKEITFEDIRGFLKLFENKAIERHSIGDILFSIDAERSVGLLSLLMERYDVILMNPPYGDVTLKAKEYLKEHYPKTHNDVYSAFIEQAVDLLKDNGYVGMLTNLTFMYLGSHKWLRQHILKDIAPPRLILEFGLGILDDAAVYTAGTVLRKGKRKSGEQILFIRLNEPPTEKKKKLFVEALNCIREEKCHPEVFKASLEDMAQVPGMPYAYWVSPSLRALFTKYPPLDRDVAKRPDQPKIADVKQGLATADDIRFTRRWWEVDKHLFAKSREETFQGKKWVPFAKGEEYARYYADISLVINWERDGEKIKRYIVERYSYLQGKWEWVIKNENFYFREGLTWQRVNVLPFVRFRYLPKNVIFSVSGLAGFVNPNSDVWYFLTILNSQLFEFLINTIQTQRDWHIGYIAPLPTKKIKSEEAIQLSREAHDILREWDTGNETSTIFIKPWLAQVAFGWNPDNKPQTGHPFAEQFEWTDWEILKEIRKIHGGPDMPLKELARLVLKREDKLIKRLAEIQSEIDEIVYGLYEISAEDRALIERELRRMQRVTLSDAGTEIPPEIRRLFPPLKSPVPVDEEQRIQEHMRRLLSWYIKRVITEDEDGIVPLNKTFKDNLYDQVVALIEREWGEKRAQKMLDEIYEILGKTLEDWLFEDYFDYHRELYKNRPIFWLIGAFNRRNVPFGCFVNFHKLTADTIHKIRTYYLMKVRKETQIELDNRMNEYSSMNENEKRSRKGKRIAKEIDRLRENLRCLEELDEKLKNLTKPLEKPKVPKENASWLEQKIYEVRVNGYRPVLDYGVLVNITPLKEAKVLHKAAERVK